MVYIMFLIIIVLIMIMIKGPSLLIGLRVTPAARKLCCQVVARGPLRCEACCLAS